MTIKSSDFCDFADEMMDLGRRTKQEIYYRNAASRAYYCSLHRCRELLTRKYGFRTTEVNSHQQVIDALYGHHLEELAISLSRMRTYRVRADYELNDIFTQLDATLVLREAQSIADRT
jgi:uncharacterized protein (UPF0332 family)